MKVIWLVNIEMPIISKARGKLYNPTGGWLTGLYDSLAQNGLCDLSIVYPDNCNELSSGDLDFGKYIFFPLLRTNAVNYQKTYAYMQQIVQFEKPDIVHVWGTEYMHSSAMIEACKANQTKVIASIQGLVSKCEEHYLDNISRISLFTDLFSSILTRKFIIYEKMSLRKRIKYEIHAIRNADYVIGRTDWDDAVTYFMADKREYLFCNETLRDIFYLHKWEYSLCEKHSIFISQSDWIVKGFLPFLDALYLIKKSIPDVKVYAVGDEKIRVGNGLKLSQYQKKIQKKIRNLGLENTIIFLGRLNEKEMCDMYLKCNLFVCPSILENSPNSLGEAMLLGVPSIAADVGGVSSVFINAVDGYLYPQNEGYMLAFYAIKIFNDVSLMEKFSKNSRQHAEKTHNRLTNINTIQDIYTHVMES